MFKKPKEVETKLKKTATIEYASHCMYCHSFVGNKKTSFPFVADELEAPSIKYDSLCKSCAKQLEEVARNSKDRT